MSQSFDKLIALVPELRQFAPATDDAKFYKDEALRFHSIARTVETSFKNIATCVDERIISHILLRSVIENFFKLMFVYEDANNVASNFDKLLNGFKKDYLKLLNEPDLPLKTQLEPADASWSSLQGPMDLKSMLASLRNMHGTRLDYIYFIYRISSFDTHGNSLNSLFEASFNKKCNFPFLNIDPVLEIISDYYLTIYQKLKAAQQGNSANDS